MNLIRTNNKTASSRTFFSQGSSVSPTDGSETGRGSRRSRK